MKIVYTFLLHALFVHGIGYFEFENQQYACINENSDKSFTVNYCYTIFVLKIEMDVTILYKSDVDRIANGTLRWKWKN